MRPALLALFALVLPVAAADIPASGRIESVGSLGTCSATLIEPDLIVTAAHCLATSEAVDGKGFRTGNGPEAPLYPLARSARHPLYDPDDPDPTRRYRFDIAAARLAEPVPDWVASPLPPGGEAVPGERLFIVSWRRGEGPRPRQRACSVIEALRGLVSLSCEVRGGESGAGVLRASDNGLQLVAVLSSRTTFMGHPIALASNVRLRIQPILDLLD